MTGPRLLDDMRESGRRQAAARAELVSGGRSSGGTTMGLLLGFEGLTVAAGDEVSTVEVRRAHVDIAGEEMPLEAAPGTYVIGGTVTVQVDGTRRPLYVLGPRSTAPVAGVDVPGAGETVTHLPDLVQDEEARRRNAEVAEGLVEARESLRTAGNLIEALREHSGRRVWTGGDVFTGPTFTVTPTGGGMLRLESATGNTRQNDWALQGPGGRVIINVQGASADVQVPVAGDWWIELESDGEHGYSIESTTVTVTPEMLDKGYGWTDLTVSLDQLTAPGGPLDPDAIAALYEDVVVAGISVATEAFIGAQAIIDGAVKARHFDAVHEMPGGGAVSLKPDGLRMWFPGQPIEGQPNAMWTAGEGLRFLDNAGNTVAWLDPVEGLVLGDPDDDSGSQVSMRGLLVAGPEGDTAIELGRFARTGLTLYRDAEARAFMDDTGQVGGDVVSANNELFYRGTELTEVLETTSSRLLTRQSFTGSLLNNVPSTGGYLDVCEIQADLVPGHAYEIGTTAINCLVGGTSGDPAVAAQLFWTTDGTRPERSSDRLFSDNQTPPTSTGQRVTFKPTRFVHVGLPVTARVLLSVAASARSLSVAETATLYILDHGLDSGPTDGTLRNFVRANEADPPQAPTPSPKTRRTPINNGASWVKSWDEYDNSPSAIAGRAYQGRTPHYPSAGRYKSMAGFPSMTTPLNGADIDKIEVYVKPAHGGGNGGAMTVSVGVHGVLGSPTSLPGSFSRTTSHGLVTKTIKAGRGEWITLPSSIHAGIKDGSIRGVAFETTSESRSYYGYMYPSGIRLRVHYRS